MTRRHGSWASVILAFWILGLLNVDCKVNDDGDVECHLHTRDGHEVICRQGGEESETEKHLDLKPTMDAECMYPFLRW